jgi:hypothetical protein
MDDTRALRAKLEEVQAELQRTRKHLDKLRLHHERERDALRHELEAARREVAHWRARSAEARTREDPKRLLTLLAAPSFWKERPGGKASWLVALARSPEAVEEALPTLVRLTGLSPADVRLRLAASSPTLLALLPEGEAEALRGALEAEGFPAVTCELTPQLGWDLVQVRRFTLEEEGLRLTGPQGARLDLDYGALRLLVRGRRIVTVLEDQEPAVLVHGDQVLRRLQRKRESIEPFLWLYGEGGHAAFTMETDFGGLGEQRGLTRHAGLQALTEELCRRAPQVVLDERLQRQVRVSLPFIAEDRGQEILGALLWHMVQAGLR